MTPSTPSDQTEHFARMMRLGQACYVQGARKQAHRYWRRAALIDPSNESVWVSLLNVIETEADRRVCLENILAINPQNKTAKAQLGIIDAPPSDSPLRIVLRVVAALAIGVLLAVGISGMQLILSR